MPLSLGQKSQVCLLPFPGVPIIVAQYAGRLGVLRSVLFPWSAQKSSNRSSRDKSMAGTWPRTLPQKQPRDYVRQQSKSNPRVVSSLTACTAPFITATHVTLLERTKPGKARDMPGPEPFALAALRKGG